MVNSIEVFFYDIQEKLSYQAIYELISISLDIPNMKWSEKVHKSIKLFDKSLGVIGAIDNTKETIWHVITDRYKLYYLENNLTDFSFIGSLKSTYLRFP